MRGIRSGRFASSLAAALALLAAAAVALRGSAQPILGNQSLASALCLLTAATASIGFLSLALAPDHRWARWIEAWNRAGSRPLPVNHRLAAACIAAALGVQVGLANLFASRNTEPRDDQADYLRVARLVADEIGPGRLLEAVRTGRYREDNRHPLYVGLVALEPTLAWGKVLSLTFGAAATLAAAAHAWRIFGPAVAALAAALLAGNYALLSASSIVACETLLALLALLAWMAAPAGADGRRAIARWTLVGAWTGLAYATKASGLFLAAGAAIWLLLLAGAPWRFRLGAVAALAAGFLLVAWPLLIRNGIVYRNPLHSANTRLLFADSYEEGMAEPDLGTAANARRYFARKDAREVGKRVARGLLVETFTLARTLGPAPLGSARAAPGAIFLGLAILAVLGGADRPAAGGLLLFWTLGFWLFFAWYSPIAASDRFLVPLAPGLLLLAAAGGVRSAVMILGPGRGGGAALLAAPLLLAAVAASSILLLRTGPLPDY